MTSGPTNWAKCTIQRPERREIRRARSYCRRAAVTGSCEDLFLVARRCQRRLVGPTQGNLKFSFPKLTACFLHYWLNKAERAQIHVDSQPERGTLVALAQIPRIVRTTRCGRRAPRAVERGHRRWKRYSPLLL